MVWIERGQGACVRIEMQRRSEASDIRTKRDIDIGRRYRVERAFRASVIRSVCSL